MSELPSTQSLEALEIPRLPAEVLAEVPSADLLPVPSQAEIDATHKAAEDVASFLEAQAIPSSTRRALRTALRYWAFWHRAVYGTELELLNDPPSEVPSNKVMVFISHHAPVPVSDGHGPIRVRTGMPDHVRQRLQRLEEAEGTKVVGKRQVAKRAGKQNRLHGTNVVIDEDVPALKTLQQRVSLLGTLHRLRGLPPPQDTDRRIRSYMVTVGKATEAILQAALPQSKRALDAAELQDLVKACRPDDQPATLEGKRDQALLLAAFSSGRRRSEVASLRMEHLELGQMTLPSGEVLLGYWWNIYKMKGKSAVDATKPLLTVPLVGAAAEAMDNWLDVLRAEGFREGPVWRRIYKKRLTKAEIASGATPQEVLGAGLRGEDVATIVKRRATQALLARRPELQDEDDPAVKQYLEAFEEDVSAHSLRSGFITSQIQAGTTPLHVMKLTGHTSMSSFRIYDQSDNSSNPALVSLMQLTL